MALRSVTYLSGSERRDGIDPSRAQPASSQWASELATAQQMHVDVIDYLASVPVHVEHRSVSGLSDTTLARNPGCNTYQPAGQSFISSFEVVQSPKVLPRHDHDVDGCLRIDILERNNQIVFVDTCRWQLTLDNLAE